MSVWLQIILFLIPGLLIYYSIFYGTPRLVKSGKSLIFSFWFGLWAPVMILLPLSLLLFLFLEDGSFTINAFIDRFRLTLIVGKDWLWIIGGVILTIIFDQLLEPIGKHLAKYKFFSPPEYLPAPFNPLKKFSIPPKDFFGVKLEGNWKLFFAFVPLHLLAMFSEEMMWRGYILPLQESMFGSFAWLINGMFWAWILHAGLKWHLIGMIPSMLLAPFIAQLTQSTWASFAVHAIGNSPLWIILLIGIINPKHSKREAQKL